MLAGSPKVSPESYEQSPLIWRSGLLVDVDSGTGSVAPEKGQVYIEGGMA